MEFSRRGLDEHHKGDGTNEHAQHVGDVVAVPANLAGTAAVDAAVFLGLEGTGERSGDEGVLQLIGGWGCRGRDAGGFGEEVDEFEDEVARECSAQIGDASNRLDGEGMQGKWILTLQGESCTFRQWLGQRYVRGRPRWPRT